MSFQVLKIAPNLWFKKNIFFNLTYLHFNQIFIFSFTFDFTYDLILVFKIYLNLKVVENGSNLITVYCWFSLVSSCCRSIY